MDGRRMGCQDFDGRTGARCRVIARRQRTPPTANTSRTVCVSPGEHRGHEAHPGFGLGSSIYNENERAGLRAVSSSVVRQVWLEMYLLGFLVAAGEHRDVRADRTHCGHREQSCPFLSRLKMS